MNKLVVIDTATGRGRQVISHAGELRVGDPCHIAVSAEASDVHPNRVVEHLRMNGYSEPPRVRTASEVVFDVIAAVLAACAIGFTPRVPEVA